MTDIEIFEAINISVGIAVMKLKNEKFIGDVGDIIRVQIQDGKYQVEDLPNLAKSTKYMREFKYSKDLYVLVHAEALKIYMEKKMPKNVFDDLSLIYKD